MYAYSTHTSGVSEELFLLAVLTLVAYKPSKNISKCILIIKHPEIKPTKNPMILLCNPTEGRGKFFLRSVSTLRNERYGPHD